MQLFLATSVLKLVGNWGQNGVEVNLRFSMFTILLVSLLNTGSGQSMQFRVQLMEICKCTLAYLIFSPPAFFTHPLPWIQVADRILGGEMRL